MISLNFQKIDIRAALAQLAEFKGVNIVVSDNVKGDITLRLNNIAWERALEIILTTHGLKKRQFGNVLLVDTRESMVKVKKARFKSQQLIQKLEPIESVLVQINYANANDLAAMIKDKQQSLLSADEIKANTNEAKINVDKRTNTLWIQDTRSRIQTLRKLIKQLDVPVQQVEIEARIVEVSKDFSQDVGIRWGVSKFSHVSGDLEGTTLQPPNPTNSNPVTIPIQNRLNLDLMATPTGPLPPASLGVAFAKLGSGVLLDLELSALESEGRAHLISSPRIITTNQQVASIESGEEIPYQESVISGATSVSFKKAVLRLKVKPQITPDGKILMELKINQDTRSPQIFNNVPSIVTKQIQTKVLVNHGQTIVLGGIYKQDKRKIINRVPFLGDLPGVGFLFRNNRITLANQELLIFITPKIITDALTISRIEGQEKFVGNK